MKALLYSLLPWLILASSARADLEIRVAQYGNATSYRDARGIVEAYVRSNTLSFPIGPRSMGGDPNPRSDDFLYIEYKANGRDYRASAADGTVFTFKGVGNVRPVQPPLNLPFLRAPAPSASPLRVSNRSGLLVRVYAVDRFGRWVWAENVASGEGFTAQAQVGQDWVITDARHQVLQQHRIQAGENRVVLHPRSIAPGPGALTRIRFENSSRRSLYLYNLDRWGGWMWMANLEAFGVYEAATRPGEEWIATERDNRLVEKVRIAPGMTRVVFR